ncbi:hypothetical protein SETIT_1G084000v2 [Setaria italica]|uniref:Uncharacterized protein n=2 Tax=Setaria TaxID=4554 RepID=A0A368PI48_SETIT|nr:hypothetical protein SETIT_1G084000v2 [Setaria italica]TKW37939.1 hypothetical protein SEVIR_1G082200v2 [Setaria viridis]
MDELLLHQIQIDGLVKSKRRPAGGACPRPPRAPSAPESTSRRSSPTRRHSPAPMLAQGATCGGARPPPQASPVAKWMSCRPLELHSQLNRQADAPSSFLRSNRRASLALKSGRRSSAVTSIFAGDGWRMGCRRGPIPFHGGAGGRRLGGRRRRMGPRGLKR